MEQEAGLLETLSQRSVDLPANMMNLVVGATTTGTLGLHHANGAGSGIEGVPTSAWTALARWGDETGNLKYWEMGLAQTLADYVVTNAGNRHQSKLSTASESTVMQ